MMMQANTTCFEGEDPRKFEVGATLRFTERSSVEIIDTDVLEPGDLVTVDERNGCGMGIDCTRISDGAHDMLWSEEVELVERQLKCFGTDACDCDSCLIGYLTP